MRTIPRSLAALLLGLALLVSLSSFASAAPAQAADASSGKDEKSTEDQGTFSDEFGGALRFGIGPAKKVASKQIVDGRAYLEYYGTPGMKTKDTFAVFNLGAQPIELTVYPIDAGTSAEGTFGLLPEGSPLEGAGAWITLDVPANKVTVPPRTTAGYGRVDIPISINVPANASPGDHAAGIVASLKAQGQNKEGANVTLDQRVGLRTYFRISGECKPKISVENLRAHYTDKSDPLGRGTITISYDVRNTGNLQLSLRQTVEAHRLLGGTLTKHGEDIDGLLPGGVVHEEQSWKNVFGLGPITAEVVADPAISQNCDPAVQVFDVTAKKLFWAWPWLLMLEILGVVLLALLYLWWRRWRKKRREKQLAGPDDRTPGVVEPEDALDAGSAHHDELFGEARP